MLRSPTVFPLLIQRIRRFHVLLFHNRFLRPPFTIISVSSSIIPRHVRDYFEGQQIIQWRSSLNTPHSVQPVSRDVNSSPSILWSTIKTDTLGLMDHLLRHCQWRSIDRLAPQICRVIINWIWWRLFSLYIPRLPLIAKTTAHKQRVMTILFRFPPHHLRHIARSSSLLAATSPTTHPILFATRAITLKRHQSSHPLVSHWRVTRVTFSQPIPRSSNIKGCSSPSQRINQSTLHPRCPLEFSTINSLPTRNDKWQENQSLLVCLRFVTIGGRWPKDTVLLHKSLTTALPVALYSARLLCA